MSYETVAGITQSFSLLFFMSIFVLVVTYALWPANRSVFDHAARLPLDGDESGPRGDAKSDEAGKRAGGRDV